jgi:hypothetical protein
MYCFQVTERVNVGLPILWDDEGPSLEQPEGWPGQLKLDAPLAEGIVWASEFGVTRLWQTSLDVGVNYLLFKKPSKTNERIALVHIATAAGVGGKVYLTANAYEEVMQHKVTREYRPFPGAGVTPLCKPEVVAAANAGVDALNMLVMMHPGASFRIRRNGKLEGASPQLFVQWNGSALEHTLPRRYRYEERATTGFLSAEA